MKRNVNYSKNMFYQHFLNQQFKCALHKRYILLPFTIMTIILFTLAINSVVWCQEIISTRQLGTLNSDGLYDTSEEKAYVAKQTVQSSTEIETRIMTIAQAAAEGKINCYCYLYDGFFNQYVSISAHMIPQLEIPPWSGFWVIVYESLDLLIPGNSSPPGYNSEMTLENLAKGRFYFIAPPLYPVDGDINVNIGDDLGVDEHESTWRVSKWNYDTEEYNNYDGSDTFAKFLPGCGFFLQHFNQNQTLMNIDISGNPVIPSSGYFYKLQLPSNGDPYTYHMTGNPYWYNIVWKDCMVRVPFDDKLPLPKPAVIAQEEIVTWHIGLKLESFDGKVRDTYNCAGVVITPGVSPDQICAYELIPPGDFISLTVKDPSNPDRVPYSYDYRALNHDDEYIWQIELTTTYSEINTKFKLDNLDSVPENYVVTLRENKSGEVYEINEDKTFDLTLASGKTETYVLTATGTQVVVKEEITPETFGITDIRPNPFNPSTTVSYSLDRPGNVNVKIYNLTGQLIDTIVDGYCDAGFHNIVWNAKGNASGVYVVSLVAHGKRDFRKITLVK